MRRDADRRKVVLCRLAVFVLPLVSVGAPAFAGPITDADCSQPQHAQRIINHCSGLQFKAADEKLTVLFEKTLAALNDEKNRERLKTSQDAWLHYRDAQCAMKAGLHDHGSVYSMIYTTCARLLTEARITELQSFLDCDLGSDPAKCGR